MIRSRAKMTPTRAKLNTSIKRRSFNRSIKRLSNQSFKSFNASSAESSSNIKVVVRVRPLNSAEVAANSRSILEVPERTWLVFDPVERNDEFFFRGVKQPRRDIAKKANRNQTFVFDRVFDGSCPNQTVFEETTLPIIDGLMNGFNCSVFAYGATGAGKTHTMLGNAETPGISFLMVMELFRRVGLVEDKECEISVSYLEVYNETIKDLLVPSVPLNIREDSFGVKVQGLSMHKPKDAEELLQLLCHGNTNRTQHPTDANAESSRSHAVFQIHLKQKDKIPGPNERIKMGKMSLVDLAGSERATAVKSHSKARLKEGANINQSLLALGSCINALADKKKGNHVPYRNSKLTRILKDSLGGNCVTVMIAAVSPSSLTYEDTHNTLKYAARAKEIKLDLKRNTYSVESHVSQYKKIMEAQQLEIAQLKMKLKTYEEESTIAISETASVACQCSLMDYDQNNPEKVATTSRSSTLVNETPKSTELDPDFVIALDALFVEQIKIRTKMMNCESDAKLLSLKRHFKEQSHEQVQSLTWEQLKQTRSAQRMLSVSKGLRKTENRCINAEAIFAEKLEANQQRITNLLEEKCGIDAFGNNSLRRYIDNKRMEVEIACLNVQTQHINKLFKLQLSDSSSNFKLAINALQLVKDQQLLLMVHGRLTDDLKQKYENLLDQVNVPKEVMWADRANFNPEPDEYIKNYMMLKVYKFTRESISPWNRQSQSGLPCNPFSSTPYAGVTKPNLVSYHNPDKPGDHSYIRVDSFQSNDQEMEEKKEETTPVMGISPVDGCLSSVRLPPRGKCGSPFPLQCKGKPLARSLDDTFDCEANKNTPVTPSVAVVVGVENVEDNRTPDFPGKVNTTLTYDVSPLVEQMNQKETPPSPVYTSDYLEVMKKLNSTPPSPVLTTSPYDLQKIRDLVKDNSTPPSPVYTTSPYERQQALELGKENSSPPSPIPVSNFIESMDHTFVMPTEAMAGQRNGNFNVLDEVKYPINSTFIAASSQESKKTSETAETTGISNLPKEKKRFAQFSFKHPSTPKILKRFTQGNQKPVPAINVQSVHPMVRSKLNGAGVSTPNLNANAEVAPNPIRTRPTFQQPTSASKNRAMSQRNHPSGAAPPAAASSGMGLRTTSIAISRDSREPKLKKSKSNSTLYAGVPSRYGNVNYNTKK